MIASYKDYRTYYIQDLRMTGILHRSRLLYLKDRRFRFYKSLRFTEYIINCHPGYGGILKQLVLLRHKSLCNKYMWTIPPNTFGKGLSIVHTGTIVVSPHAHIGENCRIHVDVNIGNAVSHGLSGAPTLGDNVYIGPGVKIFGPIEIGDNTAIGANAVVNKTFSDGNCTIAGIPATVISYNTSEIYIGKG